MRFREDYVERLRSCLAVSEGWHAVERCFREGVEEEGVDDARPVVFAFGYMLVASRREEIRERAGVFGAQWQIGGSVFPAPLIDVSDDMLQVWAEYADATKEHPVAASRLNDLLWVRRYGVRPIDHAHAAFDGYVALADSAESMDRVDCLLRAIEIASEIRDGESLKAAVEKAVSAIDDEIANRDEGRPGIPMNLLEAIVGLKPESRPERLQELLESAGQRYGEDPFIAQSVSELKVALSPAEEKDQLQRQQIERWREEAERATGILRYVRLQQALGLARTHGFTEIAEDILVAMQSMTVDDLELKPISAEIKIPRAEVDVHLKSYVNDSESWQDALARFGSEGPPSGDVAANRKLTEELAERYPVGRIFASQVIGPHGSPTVSAGTDEEHDRLDLAKNEALSIRVWAPLGIEILEVIKAAFGAPDRNELTDFFTTDLIDRAVASRIADAVLRFFEGDDDGALHILVPQIEAAIRGAAARIGTVVIKTPEGPNPGGVRALGGLLADLSGHIDESWRRYLANALTDVVGVNLRNQLSHGLYGPAARADAAIAIHIACYLRLWRRVDERDTDDDSAE